MAFGSLCELCLLRAFCLQGRCQLNSQRSYSPLIVKDSGEIIGGFINAPVAWFPCCPTNIWKVVESHLRQMVLGDRHSLFLKDWHYQGPYMSSYEIRHTTVIWSSNSWTDSGMGHVSHPRSLWIATCFVACWIQQSKIYYFWTCCPLCTIFGHKKLELTKSAQYTCQFEGRVMNRSGFGMISRIYCLENNEKQTGWPSITKNITIYFAKRFSNMSLSTKNLNLPLKLAFEYHLW
jgi:hypothetical protein